MLKILGQKVHSLNKYKYRCKLTKILPYDTNCIFQIFIVKKESVFFEDRHFKNTFFPDTIKLMYTTFLQITNNSIAVYNVFINESDSTLNNSSWSWLHSFRLPTVETNNWRNILILNQWNSTREYKRGQLQNIMILKYIPVYMIVSFSNRFHTHWLGT